MRRQFLCIMVLALVAGAMEWANACTSAIISGKVTPDGRPIMWKNRDTNNLKNCVRYMQGEKYGFIAITSYADHPKSIWMGTNEKGFSIMNTLSYNLIEEEGEGSSKRNGAVMKRALEICANVLDFKHYLDTLSRPMNTRTNYGVIDAQGNALYFEVNSTKYVEFDVNDPLVAPHGFLVRTNYSFSGKLNEGAGYVRYQEAHEKLFTASATGEITPRWLFSNLSRSFHNPLMGIDLKDGKHNKPVTNGWFVEQDFIARRTTSCAVAIQGVRPDEDASFTTMWTIIGYPPVTPAVPVWLKGADKKLPKALTINKHKQVPLCDISNLLREQIYSYHRGDHTENYFHWELLFNADGTGYMQQTERLEKELFEQIYADIEMWRSKPMLPEESVFRLYDDCDAFLDGKRGNLTLTTQ